MAAVAAGDSAVSALTNLAATVMSVYDSVGERKVGKSDLIFAVTDWASLLRFAKEPLQTALQRKDTHARALRVMELNAALASWLAGIGFKMSSAEADWRSPRKRSQMPRFFLAKKAARFQVKLDLIKAELTDLLKELDRIPGTVRILPINTENGHIPLGRIETEPIELDEKAEREELPDTTAVVSRLRFETAKIGSSTNSKGEKRVNSAP